MSLHGGHGPNTTNKVCGAAGSRSSVDFFQAPALVGRISFARYQVKARDMAKNAITALKYKDWFSRTWRPNSPEIATLTRRDVHTVLVKWMGWEPADVTSFWLICAKLAKRNHDRNSSYTGHFLVKTKRCTFYVDGAFNASDAAAIVCENEKRPRADIQWVKPVNSTTLEIKDDPRPANVGGADVLTPTKPTQRKTHP